MDRGELEDENLRAQVGVQRSAQIANYARAVMFVAIGAASLGLVYL